MYAPHACARSARFIFSSPRVSSAFSYLSDVRMMLLKHEQSALLLAGLSVRCAHEPATRIFMAAISSRKRPTLCRFAGNSPSTRPEAWKRK